MISWHVLSYWLLAMLPECSVFRCRHPNCMLQHAEKECKAGFHFLETEPLYSLPPAEWLFIVGFVLLIEFFGFTFLRHVAYIRKKSPSFRSFLKVNLILLKSLLETIILCLLTNTALTYSSTCTTQERSLTKCYMFFHTFSEGTTLEQKR